MRKLLFLCILLSCKPAVKQKVWVDSPLQMSSPARIGYLAPIKVVIGGPHITKRLVRKLMATSYDDIDYTVPDTVMEYQLSSADTLYWIKNTVITRVSGIDTLRIYGLDSATLSTPNTNIKFLLHADSNIDASPGCSVPEEYIPAARPK